MALIDDASLASLAAAVDENRVDEVRTLLDGKCYAWTELTVVLWKVGRTGNVECAQLLLAGVDVPLTYRCPQDRCSWTGPRRCRARRGQSFVCGSASTALAWCNSWDQR